LISNVIIGSTLKLPFLLLVDQFYISKWIIFTLVATLWGYINKLPIRRLLTIEDPPEGRIYGAIQTPIIADKKNTEEIKRAWLLSMAYALRCDPDAILNGEIRDLESAITALKAAMTGHLLMTTLHANDGLNILKPVAQ
ncbi:ATPase, T2SS/T4P/T4SS family, partial [Arsenophonus sp. ENCA]|uniref:ATPase, T2SS/T4P/T4SS family n=1 Tax=Arsenophonus sp. ENCA TaxID=1987579 RepID=UPI0025B89435